MKNVNELNWRKGLKIKYNKHSMRVQNTYKGSDAIFGLLLYYSLHKAVLHPFPIHPLNSNYFHGEIFTLQFNKLNINQQVCAYCTHELCEYERKYFDLFIIVQSE